MSLKEKPFWQDTVTIPAGDPSRLLPESVDVAVVAGGITGLSVARALGSRFLKRRDEAGGRARAMVAW